MGETRAVQMSDEASPKRNREEEDEEDVRTDAVKRTKLGSADLDWEPECEAWESIEDVDEARMAQFTWVVKKVTGDEAGTAATAFDYGECEYGLLDVKGVDFHVYKFTCGDTTVGGCCKGDELELAVEISDGAFLAEKPEYKDLAEDLEILFGPDEEDEEGEGDDDECRVKHPSVD